MPFSRPARTPSPTFVGTARRCALALPFATLACAALPQTSHARPAHHAAAVQRSTFAFENADIAAVARALATVLGREILVDPRVKGTMSLVTDDAVTPARATRLFTESLRGLGYALVDANGLLKIVPEADAKLQAGAVTTTPQAPSGGGDQVVTQVIHLVYENAANLVPALRPLITANNTINVNAGNNTLVITDYASNLVRIGAIVSALDTPSATDVEVMPLQYALASDLAATVLKLSDGAATGTPSSSSSGKAAPETTASGSGGGTTSVIADPHLNALLVRAPNTARLAAIRALVAQLDRPGASGAGSHNVHVIYLEHADAARLATVLRAALPSPDALKASAGGSGSSGSSGNASGGGVTPAPVASNTSTSNTGAASSASGASDTTPVTATAQPTTGGYIQADPASNALIVTAPEPVFRDIREIVQELDVRRAQLYIESLVAEVDATKALDVGLQWKSIFDISETTELTLGTVATALQTTTGANILSTANIVTLDNEEAKIVVGQNVPYVTGSYTTTTSSSTNPFQTIERMDVGLTLRIRPQIGRNGAIRMSVLQESSSVASTSTTSGPTTNKRSIESTVVVQDGKILVLGGLIEDSDEQESDNIPVLSTIPWIGNLFRSVSKTRKKTNLLVFLRPVVMRDAVDADTISVDRYDEIRAREAALPEDVQDVLRNSPPPAIAPAAASGAAPGRTNSLSP